MSPSRGPRLFAGYVLASLVPVLGLGFVVNTLVRREIDSRALAEAVHGAQTIAVASIEPALDGTSLSAGITPGERTALEKATSALRGVAGVLRLRLRAPEGTVEFDAAHPNAGPVPNHDEEVITAASGHPVRLLTRLNADDVDRASDLGAAAVETYLALHASGTTRTIGVLEIYLSYKPFGDAAVASKRRLAAVLALGLVGLWAVLGLVTWRITRRLRRFAKENDWLAHHDRLTGLPNRLAFADRVDDVHRGGTPSLIAVLDIDRFREVNDTLGQANGDAYLCHVGASLRSSFGPNDVVARLGGDEFGVATSDPSMTFDRFVATIDAASSRSIELAGVLVSADAHIGVASTVDDLPDGAGLLRAAELALHTARETGLPLVRYRPELDHFDPEKLALVAELRSALANDELTLFYQPKIELSSGETHGAEALIRWFHPRRGLVLPTEFIPLAESTSLIGPLTAWVIDRAAKQIATWRRLDLAISINVSAANLRDDSLTEQIVRTLAWHTVPLDRLEVEITETAVVDDPARAASVLRRLHDAGVRISLDDFGEGATSLVSLARLPLDELKIDRTFILDLENDPAQQAIVHSLIELGHRLGLSVIAEGIETEAAGALLTEMGCDAGQGFLYSRAVPPEQFEDWILGRRRAAAAVH